MKKLLKLTVFALSFFTMLNVNTQMAQAADNNYVRVGLNPTYSRVDGMQIRDIAIGNTAINAFYLSDGNFVSCGRITAVQGFSVRANYSIYVSTNYIYNDYQSAKAQADLINASGGTAVCALTQNGIWNIYLGGISDAAQALNMVQSGQGKAVVSSTYNLLSLMDGSSIAAVFEGDNRNMFLSDTYTLTVNIGGVAYRGYLDATMAGGLLTPVNVIEIEDYVCSVVPSEMPSGWHIEALKAQTVAARCYTYTRKGIHAESGYDLCANTHCQVYNGFSNETLSSKLAALETKDIMAYYNDEIINATFFSSSGGITDSSENVWANEIGYLRGVTDVYDVTGKIWQRSFALNEITGYATAQGFNIGNVDSVSISEVSDTGRVLKLALHGSNGSRILEKEEVRTFFSASAGGSLESRNFRIGNYVAATDNVYISNGTDYIVNSSGLYVINSENSLVRVDSSALNFESGAAAYSGNRQVQGALASNGDTVVFSGKGWGHGVGLSQHGAKGMAEAGYTYSEILKHYYMGIELKQYM